MKHSLLGSINHALFATMAPNLNACRACVTNNFVSLGVAGSRKYVIRLVMFGGLVGFSYCSHFVLITVVWIAPHPSAPPPNPPFHKWHWSAHLNIESEFLRYLKYLCLLQVSVWRDAAVFTVQAQRGEENGWGDAVRGKGGGGLGVSESWFLLCFLSVRTSACAH